MVPGLKAPRPETPVIQVGEDPLFARYPVRGFAADVALAGAPRLTLRADRRRRRPLDARLVAERRARWRREHSRMVEARAHGRGRRRGDRPMDMAWVSRCVGDVSTTRPSWSTSTISTSTQARLDRPGRYFASRRPAVSAGALGAALGAKLAAPDRTVMPAWATARTSSARRPPRTGWRAPTTYRAVRDLQQPRVERGEARGATRSRPEGWAVRTGSMPLSDLDPAPDYEMICRACGGWASGSRIRRAARRAARALRSCAKSGGRRC